MIYQAVFSGLGEHIHVPIEADDDKQATARAMTYAEQHLPRLLRKQVKVSRLKDGEEAVDDRAVLEFAPGGRKLGRPKELQGDYETISVAIRKDLLAKIDASGKSRREYIETLLEQ